MAYDISMKLQFLYSKTKEKEKLLDIYEEYQWFIANSFSVVLPEFFAEIYRQSKNDKDIFALQAALAMGNFFPPKNFSGKLCSLSGNFGDCTVAAVKEFQKQHGIEPADGFVGPLTRKKLNELYSS